MSKKRQRDTKTQEQVWKEREKRLEGQDQQDPEYENFQDVLKKVLSVSKEELDKRRTEYEREKKEKRAG